ncbi:MAG: signal peptidase I [Erysipelotrichaceae bacterium]|nr:signal peptidase I [Erysipelotrichaceae bacterium]
MFKKNKKMKEEEVQSQVVENTEVEEETEKSGGLLNTVVNAILIFAIILAAVCTYVSFVSSSGNGVPSILGIRPFSIQTESMYPTLEPGDLIIATAVEPEDLRQGDIITYWTVINGERVLNTHRITDIYDGGTHLIFATKGDNNLAADALTVHESEVVGIYQFRMPGVGKVFDFLQTSMGFFLIIVLPVFLFFIYHLVQFFRVLFEYQNIKNRIKYEQEREITEDLIEQQKKLSEENKKMDRSEYEAELREKLKAEILAEEAKKKEKQELEARLREELKAELLKETTVETAEETVVEEEPETVEVAEETAVEETVVESVEEVAIEEVKSEEEILREKMIEEELKKREAAMMEKLREELKAQLLREMDEKKEA